MERLSDYNYELPEELIAQTPLEDRAASRLLVLHKKSGLVEHRSFRDVGEYLHAGDLLIMNDTRVSAVRLFGHKHTGGDVEALLLREISPGRYVALVKPGRRLRVGTHIVFYGDLSASIVEELPDGQRILQFDETDDLVNALMKHGKVPLPPYIHQQIADPERYQTVYGTTNGSSAAPTAGLHFTPEILSCLRAQGIRTEKVTLHVGIDTFRPVQVENLSEHKMHGEECYLPEVTAESIRSTTGRILAVGTTSVRTLESFATGPRKVSTGSMVSRLFIREGYPFAVVDGMFTNFHLPGTTMMMMISAMASRPFVLEAYRQAVQQKYRFLSFGDSMLIV